MNANDLQLQAKVEDQAFERMAPVISHEIRNPLAVIGNSAYFIKSKLAASGAVDPKVEKHLGIIESEVKRANETLGEILAYARMREPARKPQSLNDLAEQALKSLPPSAGAGAKIEPAPGDPKVSADSELIVKCIAHLIRNAAEAAAKGPARVKASVSGRLAVIEVTDSGPGLAPEARANLFTPFFTTKPRGIGLGLAFVKKAVERHGGRVRVENRDGKGAAARIELPI
ncbi:MAG: HAMP domain-containing histidine kinase [Elusimicrobia bacterium]|nr:HAMP domain-containing histidine kinase [Elusimicrobiota bacterium]